MIKLFLFLLLLPVALNAQNNTALFDSYMEAQTNFYRFNGNVLVSKNGRVMYKKSYGYADYDTKKKLDNKSIFDCGSIAKEFTAMGILLLRDKGLISYSDTLRKFFPELPYQAVTIQQLLTHTSGMPNGFGLVAKFFDHAKVATNGDLIRLLAGEKPPVLFKPGTSLMYSGTAFNLLASIIEKISGQAYKTYMKQQIFEPLGMTDTQVANGPRSSENIPGYAYGYVYSDSLKKHVRADQQKSAWPTYLAGITGEGMIITSTEDLLKWDRALKNHSLLTEATQQEMLSVQAERKMPTVSFGYGMLVGKNEVGSYIFHNGYYPGYVSMHLRYIEEDITVIVLSNNESRADFIADGLAAIGLNKTILVPYRHKEIEINTPLDKYAGHYSMQLTNPPYMATWPVEFMAKNKKLYIHSGRGADTELKPESEKKFFFGDSTDQQIEFETDTQGNPVKVWHIAWGVKRKVESEK